eukprot:7621575-Pyramimonas_sp.AAC.1
MRQQKKEKEKEKEGQRKEQSRALALQCLLPPPLQPHSPSRLSVLAARANGNGRERKGGNERAIACLPFRG